MTDKKKPEEIEEPSKPPVAPASDAELKMRADFEARMAQMEALVKSQSKALDAMRGAAGLNVGKIDYAHCNLCGARADAVGLLPCGHTELVSHVGRGNRIMPNGDVELALVKQTAAA